MALTDTQLKALKPRDKPYTVTDGDGLYIEVLPTGGVCWRYRYRLAGKQEMISLGQYPEAVPQDCPAKAGRVDDSGCSG